MAKRLTHGCAACLIPAADFSACRIVALLIRVETTLRHSTFVRGRK